MSFHRENVTWQSQDKTWSLGFFTVIPGNTWDEDYDPEWDVDYDFSSFEWVTSGHPTEDAAFEAWRGANPGGGSVVAYAGHSKEAKAYDLMALWCRRPDLKEEHLKKEARKAKREHFKKLTEDFEAKHRFAGLSVRVTFKKDADVHSYLGVSESATGHLLQKGDWLTLQEKRVFNTKTGKFAPNIHALEESSPRYATVWR